MKSIKGKRDIDVYNMEIEIDGLAAVCNGLSLMAETERLSDEETSLAFWGLSLWARRISEDLELIDEEMAKQKQDPIITKHESEDLTDVSKNMEVKQ